MVKNSRDRVRKHRALRKVCAANLAIFNKLIDNTFNACDFVPQTTAVQDTSPGDENILVKEKQVYACFDAPTYHRHCKVDDAVYMLEAHEQSLNLPSLINFEEEMSDHRNLCSDASRERKIELTVEEELHNWALQCKIQQNHLDSLLGILRKKVLPNLPKTAKTFLNVEHIRYNIIPMEDADPLAVDGEFVYLGLRPTLEKIINPDLHDDMVIDLLINIDGMPLDHSGSKSAWPVLCKVYCNFDVYSPFPVAIYLGSSKPNSLECYLTAFIEELNQLLENGIVIEDKEFRVNLMAFVADTPARAWLKCVKGHGGYHACERCLISGELVKTKKGQKIVYPGINYPRRSKESFIRADDSDHHTGITPLLLISPQLDLTKVFVLDSMHLFFSGGMKNLITQWMVGPLMVRLSIRQKNTICYRLALLKTQVPAEFQRKPKNIFKFNKWKATELRFFLLYCGPVVLKNILSKKLYDHFLLLHVACRILCSEQLAVIQCPLAEKLLKKFVLALPLLYGQQAVVINMHNLLHISDDVRSFNCPLTKINCFPFENYLGTMKKMIRTPNKPLAQLCRRLGENNAALKKPSVPNQEVWIPLQFKKDCLQSVSWNATVLSTRQPNDMVLLKNNTIMKITAFHLNKINHSSDECCIDNLIIEGKIWKVAKLAYSYPVKSSMLNTWKINLDSSAGIVKYHLTSVSTKLVGLKFLLRENKRELFVSSYLH